MESGAMRKRRCQSFQFAFHILYGNFKLPDFRFLLLNPAAHIADVFLIFHPAHFALQIADLPLKIKNLLFLAPYGIIQLLSPFPLPLLAVGMSAGPKAVFSRPESLPQLILLCRRLCAHAAGVTVAAIHALRCQSDTEAESRDEILSLCDTVDLLLGADEPFLYWAYCTLKTAP